MRDFIKVAAGLVFTLASFALMLHVMAWMLGFATFATMIWWFVPISISSAIAALTNQPSLKWESDIG